MVARAHEHIHNQRLDFVRKLAMSLLARFDLVAYEDLAISRMVHGHLAKSIYDAAWGTFLHALACKAEEAGKWAVPVDPRGTSQRCSSCQRHVPKNLSQREHRCECGLVIHRDENSARNVLALGLSAAQLTEASKGPRGL
jgi:putative transposase